MRFPTLEVVRDVTTALTTTYVPGNDKVPNEPNEVDISGGNQLALFLTITKGALTSIEIKVEIVAASGELYEEVSAVSSGGVTALRPMEYSIAAANLGTSAHRLFLPIPVLGDRVRVSAKGTGTTTNSQLQIHAAVAIV